MFPLVTLFVRKAFLGQPEFLIFALDLCKPESLLVEIYIE